MTLALLVLLALGPDGPEQLRQRGGELLAEGDTLGAIATLDASVAGEWTNPDVLLTLGRTHLANGETGSAVLALERASRLAPTDSEIGAARREAYARAGQVAPAVAPPFIAARTVVSHVGAATLVALALLLYLGMAVLGFLWWRRKRSAPGWAAIALAPLALGLLVLAGVALWDAGNGRAVVLTDAPVFVRPTPESDPVGTVREGEVVRVGEAVGEWRRVDVGEAHGWVPSRAVAEL